MSAPIDVKFDLPTVANKALEPVATNIGNTLSSFWNLIFGGFDVWVAKKQVLRSANLEIYKTETERKVRLIKEQNLQEPKMNIIGPALESSKFFFEEEHYREMFSNLVSASIDKSFNDTIHTSFSNIITQLSPNEANMLKQIFEREDKSIPCVKLSKKSDDKNSVFSHPLLDDVLLGQSSLAQHDSDTMCLDNLVRLNLIRVDYDTRYADESKYNDFNEHPIVFEYKEQFGEDLIIHYGIVVPTTYGMNFMKVCLR